MSTVRIQGPAVDGAFFSKGFKEAELKLCLSNVWSGTPERLQKTEIVCGILKHLCGLAQELSTPTTVEALSYNTSANVQTYAMLIITPVERDLFLLRTIIENGQGCLGHCWQIRLRLRVLAQNCKAMEQKVAVQYENVSSTADGCTHAWYKTHLHTVQHWINQCWIQLVPFIEQDVALRICADVPVGEDDAQQNWVNHVMNDDDRRREAEAEPSRFRVCCDGWVMPLCRRMQAMHVERDLCNTCSD